MLPPSSPFLPLLLFLLLLLLLTRTTLSLTHPTDLSALKSFHASILPSSIPPWSCLASWDFSSSDPCAVPRGAHFTCGVSCTPPDYTSRFHRITSLTLDPAGYSSSRPLPPLPPSLLHLDLPPSLLPSGGSLPSPLPSSLLTLSLPSNSLTGPLPSSPLPRNLTSLDLSRNSLSGPLPSSLCSLRSLRTLDLSFNRLSGSLPHCLPHNLAVLALRANLLSGPLFPSTFSPLRRLEVAELAANSFSGAFPLWFLRLPSLQQVNLANNSLSRFDAAAGGAGGASIVAVDLGFNRIAGRLPVELAWFESLAALSARHNRLTGAIPWEYYGAKKGRPFRRLFLDGNFLNGRVPAEFIAAGDLAGSFSDNCLEGCSAKVALCGPAQKPADVCRGVYGRGT